MPQTKNASKGLNDVNPERLIDLVNLTLAFDAFDEVFNTRAIDPGELEDQGIRMLRRYMPELLRGVEQHLRPLAERPDGQMLSAAFHQAERTTEFSGRIRNLAGLFNRLLPWLRTRPNVLRSVFAGDATRTARQVLMLVGADTPEARLAQAAVIPSVSGLSAPRQWIRKAAAHVGVTVNTAEALLADAETAAGLGEDLAEAEGEALAAPVNSQTQADAIERRAEVAETLKELAESSENPPVVMAAAAAASKASTPRGEWQTALGKKLGHSPEQEQAMMAQGPHVIAAGAGSGKTRVLASKVGYCITDLGIPPSSVMACSFTNKASAELIERIEKYGAPIDGPARDGFGTTHSIAGRLLNTRAKAFRRSAYIGKDEGWKQNILIRLAMRQVQMAGGRALAPPPPKGMWDGAYVQTESVNNSEFIASIDDAIGYYQWASRTWSGGAAGWAAKQIPFLQGMRSQDPRRLSQNQRTYLNDLFAKVKRKGVNTLTFRVGADEEPAAKPNKLAKYVYYNTPAGQWFNLGRVFEGKQGKEPSVGTFKNAISILKGKGLSPTEAWHGMGPYEAESDEAAVYAAYEWLKGAKGEPEFQAHGDMDDILIDTVRALVGSPTLRAQIQTQYKAILVDEAQDLNRVQHIMFGLMAGYIDASTLKPRADGQMSARVYSHIGDDKQAIYEFRGADPDEFIEMSDLVPGGAGFKTFLLDTNYRSGREIVDGAGRLIAHNEKQIPMVCKANPDRGDGALVSRSVEDTGSAAALVAEEVDEVVRVAEAGSTSWKDFGIAVRSNAEAYAYGLEMLVRGIPFKSNANFFSDKNTKALIGWLTLAEVGIDGPPARVNPSVVAAVMAPYSMLGKTFKDVLQDRVGDGNWARWLIEGGWRSAYTRSNMTEALRVFVSNMQKVVGFTGAPAEVLSQILLLTGLDGKDVRQAMIDEVKEDDQVMSELAAEAGEEGVTDEMIEAHALAPIAPLIGLVQAQKELGPAMAYVRELQEVNSKLSSRDSADEIKRDAVTISTMHGWKGLEVPRLYVPVVGGKFPRTKVTRDPLTGQPVMDPEAEEGPALWSERRLAYVAITRAQDKCTLLDIPHPKFKIRSQFIGEACAPAQGGSPEDQPRMAALVIKAWTDAEIEELKQDMPADVLDWNFEDYMLDELDDEQHDDLETEWFAGSGS